MNLLIYLSEEKMLANEGRGGPYGVGYYIYQFAKKEEIKNISFIKNSNVSGNFFYNIWQKKPVLFSKHINFLKHYTEIKESIKGKYKSDIINDYDAVHFHITKNISNLKKELDKYKGIVLLSSHTPVPYHQEYIQETLTKPERIILKKFYSKAEQIDSYAFRRADYIIFPCPEAEESYIKNWAEYSKIKEEKKECFRYLPTGIAPKNAALSRNEIRKKYDIPDDAFLISFMGRHNEIKGYDILKNVARVLFDKSDEYRVIAAGYENPIKRLQHKYWTEVGYTKDPYSLIAASDVYFLPNRETYFDLVMLEALSLKKIVIASRTGGNKFFERNNVKGVFLYDTFEEAIKLLESIKNMSETERKKLGEENYIFYLNNLTDEAFFEKYMKLIEEIGKEHGI